MLTNSYLVYVSFRNEAVLSINEAYYTLNQTLEITFQWKTIWKKEKNFIRENCYMKKQKVEVYLKTKFYCFSPGYYSEQCKYLLPQ